MNRLSAAPPALRHLGAAALCRFVLTLALLATIGLNAAPRAAFADTACVTDTGDADDINANQKDLNEFCQSAGNVGGPSGCLAADANLTWTWDDTGWTGANTGDACALYDTDDDGKANFALCASVEDDDPAVQKADSPKFYACDDSKTLNCGGSSVQTAASTCAVSDVEDAFTGAHAAGNVCNGDACTTRDTQAQCCVKLADFPSGTPELIDVCSYPSSSPSSSPSECVKAVLCTTDDDCSALNDACNVGACVSDGLTKSCVPTPKTDGTSCDDSDACTGTDTCQDGVCTGADPVVCTALDQCHDAGTCDTETGLCSNPAKSDGSTCNDGNACTQTDTCTAGTCGGANPVVCTALDQCHDAGTCDTTSGACSNPAKADGSTCSDGNACTQTDTCTGGTCGGANPVVCSALDQCHDAGTCDTTTGVCSNPAKANGSTCTDGDACTVGDTCQAGSCSSGNAVTCTALDQCHDAGTCNPSTGVCSNPNKANGTPCSDGSACTLSDTCQDGSCVGGNGPTSTPGCKNDTGGADDAVGQKDLSQFCVSSDATCAGTIFTWQWDDTEWSGKNTGDACALYDSDGDQNANFALCVTVAGKPAGQAGQSPRFYTCGDSKQFNCTGAAIKSNAVSTCSVTSTATDAFAALARKSNKCGGGSCLTKDTRATCCVKTADLPATAVLIDVCSYPSQSPSSDPSECVKTVFCSSNADCTSTNGEGTCPGRCVSVGGVNQCVF